MNNRREVYFNAPQLENMAVAAKNTYLVASRGLGKSEGFDATYMVRNMLAMPRSCGGFVSPTYAKALQNTLPAICHALSRWGYIKDVHYYIGVKPPKSAGFPKPYIQPFNYDNVLSFYNGSIMHILSLDRAMSANSMNLDWLLISEAKYIDYGKLKSEIFPANRGNRQYFGDCPWHHSVQATTDMPTSSIGMWILEKEKDMDPELIDGIKQAYLQYKHFQSLPEQTAYVKQQIREYSNDLKDWRANATFFAEYSIIDNFEILGEEWIYQMKRDLPDLLFRTSICNERIRKVANGFYPALDDKIHFYIPHRDNGKTQLYDIERYKGVNYIGDADIEEDKPLWIAFDSNSAINSLCVGQVVGNELRTLKSFYVKTPKKLQELCVNFCDYYKGRSNANIIFCYDTTFVWTTGASGESYADTIHRILTANNWSVTHNYIGNAPRHDWKHKEIDRALKGESPLLFPRFNMQNNEYLKLAMEQAGIKMGRNGFEKNKDPEKQPDSPNLPDEQKT
ncbi:MAG: hypothetical protein ACRCZB_08970, partial [Bacteroidales bacterium]